MISSTDPRPQRLLGGDRYALLRKRLRQRFERAPLDATVENFRIGKLTAEEHAALASLLDALEQLDGPITNLATTRLALQTMWSDVLGGCTHRELIGLLQAPVGIGLLKRLARQSPPAALQICRRVEAVLQRLPASGITRSQLAADVLGDAHALDSGQPTATLVLTVWRQVIARTDYNSDDVDSEPTGDG